MNSCGIKTCDRPRHAHGYCGMHAQRLRRTGDALGVRRRPSVEVFWSKVEMTESCWNWTGEVLANGYGKISARYSPAASGTKLAHRVSYELTREPVPDGLHLDHLCRNRLCVNPGHLEPVSVKENVARGMHGRLRTHCGYGHELTPENTQYDRKRNCRRCRTCAREWDRRAKAKKAARRAGR